MTYVCGNVSICFPTALLNFFTAFFQLYDKIRRSEQKYKVSNLRWLLHIGNVSKFWTVESSERNIFLFRCIKTDIYFQYIYIYIHKIYVIYILNIFSVNDIPFAVQKYISIQMHKNRYIFPVYIYIYT